MDLLPYEIRVNLPALYATEEVDDPLAQVKLFTPWTSWTWYIVEYDQEDMCFGLVDGFEVELGYFSLRELKELRGPGGITIERDESFKPTPVSILRQRSR